MAANMYRVGDYVYFEVSSSLPYQIRRIEELIKTPNGNVEAKVMCFFRRRDLSSSVISLADKHHSALEEEQEKDAEQLTEKQKHQLKHRELFLSRQIETLPATHIRGKCTVTLLNETESLSSYLTKEDTFFYTLVYDPQQKTLLADKGEIRVGSRFQAEVPPSAVFSISNNASINSNSLSVKSSLLNNNTNNNNSNDSISTSIDHCITSNGNDNCNNNDNSNENEICSGNESENQHENSEKEKTLTPVATTPAAVATTTTSPPPPPTTVNDTLTTAKAADIPAVTLKDERDSAKLETLVYKTENGLTDKEIDKYLIIAKSVGTFARALDHSSSIKQPSLHMSAAAASRDITIQYAMDLLHKSDYNLSKAILSLVPSNGPVLCRDEMEEWSSSEANLFEEAIEKYGKDFNDIRQDFLPWKSLQNIVEYYYMWKTTDRYVQQKRVKAVEAESKLKQVYIPNHNKQMSMNSNGLGNENGAVVSTKPCESCGKTNSSQWYPWGPAHVQCRLCNSCWIYWKKFSGLKYQTKLEDVEKINQVPRTNDHQNAQYPCRECNKIFNRQERLIAHLATHRPHRCTLPGCGKEFKFKAHLIRHCAQIHGVVIRAGSPRPIVKTRAAFYLHTSQATKTIRRVFTSIIKPRKLARSPFVPVNSFIVKQECGLKFPDNIFPTLSSLKAIIRGKVSDVSHRLGTPQMPCPEWLIALPKDQLPKPERMRFPPPEKGKDGQFIIPRPVPMETNEESYTPKASNLGINNVSPSLLRKRTYEQQNGGNGAVIGHNTDNNNCPVPLKRRSYAQPSIMPRSSHSHDVFRTVGLPRDSLLSPLNGRAKVATITRVGGRKQMISWVDAPDDVYFIATESTKRLRKHLTPSELKRSARRPWRRVPVKSSILNSLAALTHPLNSTTHNSSSSGPAGSLNTAASVPPIMSEPISMTMMD